MPAVLHNWVALIAEAEADLQAAQVRRQDAERRRANSLPGRLLGWLSATRKPRPLGPEVARLQDVRENAARAAEKWVVATAGLALARSLMDVERHADQALRRDNALMRLEQVRRFMNLVEEAHRKLVDAERACSNAATTEGFDMMTTSHAVSLMSSADTSRAGHAIQEAKLSLQALSEAVPSKTGFMALIRPDDFFDLVVDFAISPAFDFLSFSNMAQLQKASEQCRQAANELNPLRDRARKVLVQSETVYQAAASSLFDIERPYLEDAAALVPREITMTLPKGLGVSPA